MSFANYISGFVDGEGRFCISFSRRTKLKTGIEVRPSFSVSQKKYSLPLLQQIQDYFGCGGIRYSKFDGCYKYEVRSNNDLMEKIIPHFEKYILRTAKQQDFEKFKKICKMISKNFHRSKKYLPEIIDIAYQINLSGKRKYKKQELLKHLTR